MLHDDETLIFLHVPKCAGTTMQHVVERYFPDEAIYIPRLMPEFPKDEAKLRASLAGARLVRGHVQVGLERYVRGRAVFMTVLREPVQRVVSLYYHMRNLHQTVSYDKRRALPESFHVAGRVSLREFVCYDGMEFINRDGMCTFFCDDHWCPEVLSPDEKLARAKLVIDRCAVVGVAARLGETIDLMCWRFGWDHPGWFADLNKGSRLRLDEIDPVILATIRRNNVRDMELFQYARARFEADLAAMDAAREER